MVEVPTEICFFTFWASAGAGRMGKLEMKFDYSYTTIYGTSLITGQIRDITCNINLYIFKKFTKSNHK